MADAWLSNVWPPDAAVALRSYPRRFRALLAAIGDDEHPDDVAHRPGPGGRSALDHASDAVTAFRVVDEAIRRVVAGDRPEVPSAAVDQAERTAATTGVGSTQGVLAELDAAAKALATQVEAVASDDWTRAGTVAGTGREVSALDLLREAVRAGHDRLRDAEEALAAVRGRPLDVEGDDT